MSKSNILVDGKTLSARDLASSSECYSDTAVNEQQAIVSEEIEITSKQNKTITVQLLENVNVSTGEAAEVPIKAPEVLKNLIIQWPSMNLKIDDLYT